MRPLASFIFAYVLLGLQVGVSRYVAFRGAAPNLGLLAVLFLALNMRRDPALLASFMIGFTQDLLSQQQPGLYALSYGFFCLLIGGSQRMINRDHPLTHFTLALAGGVIVAVVMWAYRSLHPAAPVIDGKITRPPMRVPGSVEITRILYTAAVAPFLLFVLQRIRDGGARKRQGRFS